MGVDQIELRYNTISSYLSERAKRIWAASEALSIGWGGDSVVYEATGISRITINKGKKS